MKRSLARQIGDYSVQCNSPFGRLNVATLAVQLFAETTVKKGLERNFRSSRLCANLARNLIAMPRLVSGVAFFPQRVAVSLGGYLGDTTRMLIIATAVALPSDTAP
ncbi:MAG TPA: hypothetical protein PLD41_08975 [Casimicrobium huifangae]|nr:hypothetical protein [Casimicrobium huifangae]